MEPARGGAEGPATGLKKQLADEYEDLPEEKVDEIAKLALDELTDAPVREFVPIMAWRRARERLRQAS